MIYGFGTFNFGSFVSKSKISEAIIRIYAESKTETTATKLAEKIMEDIKNVVKSSA